MKIFLLLTTCFVAVLYSTSLFKFYISIWIVPLMFEFIIKVIWCWKYIVSPLDSVVNITSTTFSVARIVILLPILLKFDGIINWSWILALAGYWISCLPLAFASTSWIGLFLNSLHNFFYYDVSLHSIVGSYWHFYLTWGITSSTFISIYYFILIFEFKVYPCTPTRIFMIIFLPILAFMVLLIIKTLIWVILLIEFKYCYFILKQD